MWLWRVGLLGTIGCDADTEDTGAQEAVQAEAPDWAAEVPGTYIGTEFSPTIGTLVSTYEVAYAAEAERFEISEAPQGRALYLKLYFTDVVVDEADADRGRFTVPEQVYAEGQTGQAELILTGSGAFSGFDGEIGLSAGTIVLEGEIGAFGGTEDFSFSFERVP